ncbi:MAG: hydrogenase maturation nickel metallochaperone HypA [Curvibacter sp.]|nr:MAG: hydrogenase maturation nickel metallochaperone HypA [Curvibacter sp.]
MHELSLAEEIVRMVESSAARDHFSRVATLKLEAGALAGVEVAALRFALEAMVPGTCLEGAAIVIDEPPGRAWCNACATEVTITTRADPCPACDGYPLKVLQGDALRVVDLVVVEE